MNEIGEQSLRVVFDDGAVWDVSLAGQLDGPEARASRVDCI
jgi:hypothetical protein